jgi:hypothetical protein
MSWTNWELPLRPQIETAGCGINFVCFLVDCHGIRQKVLQIPLG